MLQENNDVDNFDASSGADAACVSQKELLKRVHEQFPEVTDRQLDRWRSQDCLPRTDHVHTIGVRGSSAYYPAHAVSQALAICRLQTAQRYSFDELRVLLWLDGYPIPLGRIHTSLQSLTERTFEKFRVRWPVHVARSLAQQVLPRLSHAMIGGRIGRVMSRSEQIDYLTAQFLLLAGHAPGFDMTHHSADLERPLTELVVNVYGLERAQIDAIGNMKPWLPSLHEVGETLYTLAKRRVFTPRYALATIKHATPQALRQALMDRHLMLVQLPQVAQGAEALFRDNAFGFGIFRVLADELPKADAIAQALFIVILLVVRRSGYGNALDQIATDVRPAAAAYKRWQAICQCS